MNKFGFDTYSFSARLQPMLIVLFPIILAFPIWSPTAFKLGATLVSLTATCGILVVFSHLARSFGLKAQDKLVSEWGGMPTTLSLRHSDGTLDEITTSRYHNFLQHNVPGWVAPNFEEEDSASNEADHKYNSAVIWLRENTRDPSRFPLILKENISYGFRRNLYGLKPFGLTTCILAFGVSVYFIWGTSPESIFGREILKSLYILVAFFFILWWSFAVTKEWVKSAAISYSRALLAACDKLS